MHDLHLTTPLSRGAKQLQESVNLHFRRWGVPADYMLAVDDVFGRVTYAKTREACFGFGINGADHNSVPVSVQQKLLDHTKMTKVEDAQWRARAGWRQRFTARLIAADRGPHMAVSFANAMAAKGIVEIPSGSNSGPFITGWLRLAGGSAGEPWCAAFAHACLVAGGLRPFIPFLYCPYIEGHARAAQDGWSWHPPSSTPQAGWLVLFTEGTIAGHVEVVVATGTPLRAVGGNTSAGNGSPNEGGGVYAHNFATYKGLPVRGYAAPKYG